MLQCAKHNAKVYGVADKITWFEGDCFQILKNQLKDLAPYSVLFASPPWGGMFLHLFHILFPCTALLCIWQHPTLYSLLTRLGPGYRGDAVFNLKTMEPYSLSTLYKEYSAFTEHMVLFLPRTSDLRQLAKVVKEGHKAAVEHYCIEGASKALCVYYGGFNLALH